MTEKTYYPRFRGSFVGRNPFSDVGRDHHGEIERATTDRVWDITIYTTDEPAEIGELTFAVEAPLLIEWGSTAPEDVIEGSTATLNLITPAPYYYADLYATDPLAVTIEIAVSGHTVWRGSLDPELYSEASGPEANVEVTFVDFDPTARVDFEGHGRLSLGAIVRKALAATALPPSPAITLSTTHPYSDTPVNLDDLYISADNFFDEDGTPATLHDALETILRPLALHIRQIGGVAHIFDWDAIPAAPSSRHVTFTSTDAAISVAPVAHKVTLNYSTYADATLADGTIEPSDLPSSQSGGEVSVRLNYDYDDPNNAFGFRVVSPKAIPEDALPRCLTTSGPLFRIISGHSGSDTAGILGLCHPAQGFGLSGGIGLPMITNTQFAERSIPATEVMTLTGPWLPSLIDLNYYIKLSLSVLIDPRYNPYEDKGKYNEGGNYDDMQDWVNFAYIPCALELVGDGDKVLAHYDNHSVVASDAAGDMGEWVAGPATPGDMWLAYYDPANRKSASGLCGWKTNRQAIGYWRGDLPAIYDKRGEGEFVPSANLYHFGVSGYLRLRIFAGLYWYDYGRKGEADPRNPLIPDSGVKLGDIIRWALYGEAEMEIVRVDGTEIETDDVIYTATAIPGAASDIEVDLQAGSAVKAPTARAVISMTRTDAPGLHPVKQLCRHSQIATPEQLLLDNLITAYDTPRPEVSGEIGIDIFVTPPYARPYTYAVEGLEGRSFLPDAVSIDAVAGTAVATLREIVEAQYTPNDA